MIGFAVIGSGFGDEGKGLMTDFLTRSISATENYGRAAKLLPPATIRFNGGGQAGHTVVDGKDKHVFNHIGSGTLAGARTYLASNFIVNPYLLSKELDRLKLINKTPHITVHPNCQVSTVFDMMLNQAREESRGINRHGSCGSGINETITRQLEGISLTIDDARTGNIDEIMRRIYIRYSENINNLHLPDRERFLAFDPLEEATNIRARVRKDIDCVSSTLYTVQDYAILEGAQGLMLDEELGTFPHVTRSNTGLPAALLAAYQVGIKEVRPIYVTRAYSTRHGAGQLDHEGQVFSARPIFDETNLQNNWQGKLRFAPLDVSNTMRFIKADLERSTMMSNLLRIKIGKPSLAITCLDQVTSFLNFYNGAGELIKTNNAQDLISEFRELIDVRFLSYGPSANDVIFLSYGPSANDVRVIKNLIKPSLILSYDVI